MVLLIFEISVSGFCLSYQEKGTIKEKETIRNTLDASIIAQILTDPYTDVITQLLIKLIRKKFMKIGSIICYINLKKSV